MKARVKRVIVVGLINMLSLLQKLLLFLLIFFLPLQKRIVIFYSPIKNHFNEWSAISLYVNDAIFIMLLLTLLIPPLFRWHRKKHYQKVSGFPNPFSSFFKKLKKILSSVDISFSAATPKLYSLLSLQLFLLFIFLANFDHYFWSLHNGRLLFWFILILSTLISSGKSRQSTPLQPQNLAQTSEKKTINSKTGNQQKINNFPLFSFLILLFIFYLILLTLLSSTFALYQIYFTIRLLFYLLFFLVTFYFFRKYKNLILYSFLSTTLFQGLLALIQFFQQKSLGLKLFAESPLSSTMQGAAKIVIQDTPLLRAYGLLPHPNILAASLLVSFIIVFYFLQKMPRTSLTHYSYQPSLSKTKLLLLEYSYLSPKTYDSRKTKFLFLNYLFLFINLIYLIALFFTFSRTAWLAFIIIILSFLPLYKKLNLTIRKHLIILLLFSLFITLLNYQLIEERFSTQQFRTQTREKKYILKLSELENFIKKECSLLTQNNSFKEEKSSPLIASFQDYSQKCLLQNLSCSLINRERVICSLHLPHKKTSQIYLRLKGIKIATRIIREHPLVGIGPGLFVLKMQEYTEADLETWEFQPVHNLFLLQATELGLIGFVLFNLFVGQVLQPYKNFTNLFVSTPASNSKDQT